jgi:ABC-type multidrug transport system fused ATPase/permease subunit
MSGYNLRQIIGQIWEGSSINILTFKHSLSSQPRINSLKSKTIHTNSVPKLLTGLAGINPTKLALSLLLFSFKLATVIAGPFIINFIIQNILNPADSALPFTLLLLLTVLYKAVSSVIVILCNFVYSSMGFEYFAYLYWYLLNHYHRLLGSSGRKVNILEYDCNLLTNLPYSALTSLFYLL